MVGRRGRRDKGAHKDGCRRQNNNVSKVFTLYSLEPVTMLGYMAKARKGI